MRAIGTRQIQVRPTLRRGARRKALQPPARLLRAWPLPPPTVLRWAVRPSPARRGRRYRRRERFFRTGRQWICRWVGFGTRLGQRPCPNESRSPQSQLKPPAHPCTEDSSLDHFGARCADARERAVRFLALTRGSAFDRGHSRNRTPCGRARLMYETNMRSKCPLALLVSFFPLFTGMERP